MKKEKLAKAFKTYNSVMSEVWKFLTIILIGLLIGWLIEAKTESKYGYLIAIILSCIIGLIVFFVGLIKLSEKEQKNDALKKNQEPKE